MASRIETLESGQNYTLHRVVVDSFLGIDQSKPPSKISLEQFRELENMVQAPGSFGALENRRGIQRINSNALTANPILQLKEAGLNEGYYLIGKDNTNTLSYVGLPYTGSWGLISNSELAARYEIVNLRSNIYICNRTSSGLLGQNKVWNKTRGYDEHGCVPPSQEFADDLRMILAPNTAITPTGLTPGRLYYYVVTYLYDGYQESSALHYVSYLLGGATYALNLSQIPVSGSNRVTARKIYRSKGLEVNPTLPTSRPFPDYFYFLTTLNDNTTTTYVDGMPDDNLGDAITPTDLFISRQPYRSRCFTVHKERLIQGNLQVYSSKYSAIDSSDITLTQSSTVPVASTGLTLLKTYKYRFYKAYPAHSSNRQVWIVGDYTEKSITLTGANNTISLTIDSSAEIFSDGWCDHILVERTLGDGNDFYIHHAWWWYDNISTYRPYNTESAYNKAALDVGNLEIVDTWSDADILPSQSTPPVDKITAGEFSEDYEYKSHIAISNPGMGDVFDPINVRFTNTDDNQGISGLFGEQDRVIIFKPNSIYQMITNAENSEYWGITVVERHIGAAGQRQVPLTETVGHQGILQLPQPTEYIFFDKAYSDSATDEIKIYYWHSYGKPEVISYPIESYLSGSSSFKVKGMAYDRRNNWVWNLVRRNSVDYILIFDLLTRQWYVFSFDGGITLNDVIVLESGKILFAGNNGHVYEYSGSVYYDSYNGTNYAVNFTVRTKDVDWYDTSLVLTRLNVAFDTSTAGAELQAGVSVDEVQTGLINYSTPSDTNHRVQATAQLKGNRVSADISGIISTSNNKRYLLLSIMLDMKVMHKAGGGV